MLSRLRFRTKILLFPIAASVGFILMVVCAPLFAAKNEAHLGSIKAGYIPRLQASRDLQEVLDDIQVGLKDAAYAESAEDLAKVDALKDRFRARLRESRALPVSDPAEDDRLGKEFDAYYALARTTTAAMAAGELGDAVVADIKRMTEAYNAIKARLERGTKRDRDRMNQAFLAAVRANQSSMYAYVGIAAASLVIMLLLSARTTRAATEQLRHVSEGLQRMGDGNFAARVPVLVDDEIGDLARRLNAMSGTLGELVRRIAASSDQVSAAAAGMFSAVREQEASATQQTASLEEMRRTIEALAQASLEVANDATLVSQLAARSLASSQRISEQTKLVSTHSERIGQILQLIQDIADKSDLLALNAALEGTKAGEIGRGFSLVAAEMRRLSEHVMDSVRDIRKLVADMREASHASVLATEEGIKLAQETASSASKISSASTQQQEGTSQVNGAANEIVHVVNEALAASAETTRSAETLLQLSQELKTSAGTFRFADAEDGGSRTHAG